MVSQITLYLGAGMSLRQAFTCMGQTKEKKSPDVLEKECALLVRELAQGIPETEAIQRLGERSGLWEYRSFCGLLIQNRAKGNTDLLPMLQREAEKAFAERQRRARIMGNEAGTKLLMPMMLMLLVVLIVVLYPAMVSFYA
jgi:tight adherence protein C